MSGKTGIVNPYSSTWQPLRLPETLLLPLKKLRRVTCLRVDDDLFAEDVSDEQRDRVFAVMALSAHVVFQVLTQWPERMLAYMRTDGRSRLIAAHVVSHTGDHEAHELEAWPLPNGWFGVPVKNQAEAEARIPLLLQTPAAVRFVLAEPLLGRLYLTPWLTERDGCEDCEGTCGDCPTDKAVYADGDYTPEQPETCWTRRVMLDWVIAGGESGKGPGISPSHPDWFRSLRDQCAAAGVPFWFEGPGEFAEVNGDAPVTLHEVDSEPLPTHLGVFVSPDGHVVRREEEMRDNVRYRLVSRVGKEAAGDLLDGVRHHAFPEGGRGR